MVQKRRLFGAAVVALAALCASAANAKGPVPRAPEGTWFLHSKRATYSGPPAPVRSMLTKIMSDRVTFQPICTQTECASMVTIRRPPRGTPARFTLFREGSLFVGSKQLTSRVRCNGRALKATLEMTVTYGDRLGEPYLEGNTVATAVNPGGCALFRGKARGLRRHWFVGSLTARP